MSDTVITGRYCYGCRRRRAFTLIELLVVIAIISLLLTILVPVLRQAKYQARRVICVANLHQVGVAIHSYAGDFKDTIPFGPDGLPMMGGNFYTVTGDVTSLISLMNGAPVGLGLLLQNYLAEQPKVLFCPGTDQPSDADAQLARVGVKQAQCDYYYRHASVALLVGTPDTFHIQLGRLGKNRNDRSITALVMDVQFLAHPSLAPFQVVTRTSHNRKTSNILFADGQVASQDNADGRFTVDIGFYPYDALDKILKAFELADENR
jgi:prepilin-type N-terminal cleavage/methylation domain-containing protein/prepilin-type processing-associated H-X9-DG protein